MSGEARASLYTNDRTADTETARAVPKRRLSHIHREIYFLQVFSHSAAAVASIHRGSASFFQKKPRMRKNSADSRARAPLSSSRELRYIRIIYTSHPFILGDDALREFTCALCTVGGANSRAPSSFSSRARSGPWKRIIVAHRDNRNVRRDERSRRKVKRQKVGWVPIRGHTHTTRGSSYTRTMTSLVFPATLHARDPDRAGKKSRCRETGDRLSFRGRSAATRKHTHICSHTPQGLAFFVARDRSRRILFLSSCIASALLSLSLSPPLGSSSSSRLTRTSVPARADVAPLGLSLSNATRRLACAYRRRSVGIAEERLI